MDGVPTAASTFKSVQIGISIVFDSLDPRGWQRLIHAGRVFDLGQALEPGMPVSPNHPGFRMALLRRHGDAVRADRMRPPFVR